MGHSKKDKVKKARERIFLDQFIAASDRSMEVLHAGEEPDFVMADSGGEFGMELVEVFKDRTEVKPGKLASPGKSVESRRTKFLRRLAECYYDLGGPPLHVQALLPEGFDDDPKVLAQALIDARPPQSEIRARFRPAPRTSFTVRALPAEVGRYTKWIPVNNSCGWRRQDELADVQVQVRHKAHKLEAYRLVRRRVALLLYADGMQDSGMISWSFGFGPIDSCGFDEIYLYIRPSQLWQLA